MIVLEVCGFVLVAVCLLAWLDETIKRIESDRRRDRELARVDRELERAWRERGEQG